MKIYLVAGKAGSGKSEVAKIIKSYYDKKGKKAFITQFSKYLKLYAKEIIGWRETEEKPREFLQSLGVKIRENSDNPHLLIKRMKEDLQIYKEYFEVIIIDDVRFKDEIEEIKKSYDAKVIQVVNKFGNSTLSREQQEHITETALDNYQDYDIKIENDALARIDAKVREYLEREDER